jgi:hypothetical protein
MKTQAFWKLILPEIAPRFDVSKVNTKGSIATLETSLKKVIKNMDVDEFNVFLAQVVIKASSKQIMGIDLTKQIMAIKALKK